MANFKSISLITSLLVGCLSASFAWADTCLGDSKGIFKFDGKNAEGWDIVLNNSADDYSFLSAQINNEYDANHKIMASKVICLYFNNSTNPNQQSALILTKNDKAYLPEENNTAWHQYNNNDQFIHQKQLTCESSLSRCAFKAGEKIVNQKKAQALVATPGTETATGNEKLPISAGQVWVTQYNFTLKIKQVDPKTGLIIGEMVPSNKSLVLPVYGFAKKDIVLIMTRNTTWAGYIFPQEPDKLITVWYEPDANLTFNYEFPKTGSGPSVFHRVK